MRHPPSALIETIRIRNGEAPLWYLHLRRLASSCKALGIPLPGALEVPGQGSDRVHRLEVGMRGVQVSDRLTGPAAPVRLMVSRVAHHSYPYKTTDRAQFDRAFDGARAAGMDDALLLTPAALSPKPLSGACSGGKTGCSAARRSTSASWLEWGGHASPSLPARWRSAIRP